MAGELGGIGAGEKVIEQGFGRGKAEKGGGSAERFGAEGFEFDENVVGVADAGEPEMGLIIGGVEQELSALAGSAMKRGERPGPGEATADDRSGRRRFVAIDFMPGSSRGGEAGFDPAGVIDEVAGEGGAVGGRRRAIRGLAGSDDDGGQDGRTDGEKIGPGKEGGNHFEGGG